MFIAEGNLLWYMVKYYSSKLYEIFGLKTNRGKGEFISTIGTVFMTSQLKSKRYYECHECTSSALRISSLIDHELTSTTMQCIALMVSDQGGGLQT